MDTGAVSAQSLGMNTRKQYEFTRRATDDPIFPTTMKRPNGMPNYTIDYYANTEDYARPLACVDFTGWRDRDQGLEWHPILEKPLWETVPKPPGALWLLYTSPLNSYTYQSISALRGLRLDAASKTSMSTSEPLDKEQWRVEARQLFETSHARINVEARNIATGVYSKYNDGMKMHMNKSMCDRTYLYRVQGCESVNALWFLVALIPTCLIILFAWPIETNGEEILLIERLCGDWTEWLAYLLAFDFANVGKKTSASLGLLMAVVLRMCRTIFDTLSTALEPIRGRWHGNRS
ncbi:MAG: hypothetical protein Q9184_006725 [Pyrenodesmia sp. 2 TL-2023]